MADPPRRARERLLAAVRKGDPDRLEATLIDLAGSVGGSATLFSWVSAFTATPVSTLDAPGVLVDGPQGSLLVDLFEDPYLLNAEIGVALVSSDGHVIVRYTDTATALLSPDKSPQRAGWALARAMAEEVRKVWPDDPALYGPGRPATPEALPLLAVTEYATPRRIDGATVYGRDGARRAPSAIGSASPERP